MCLKRARLHLTGRHVTTQHTRRRLDTIGQLQRHTAVADKVTDGPSPNQSRPPPTRGCQTPTNHLLLASAATPRAQPMQTTEAEPAGSRAVTKGARVKGSEGEGRRKRRTRLSSGKKLGGASAERCRQVEQTSSTTCSYMGEKNERRHN